jgi:hypothetical protein
MGVHDDAALLASLSKARQETAMLRAHNQQLQSAAKTLYDSMRARITE